MASNLQIIINGIDNASGAFSDVGDAMDGLTGKSKGLLSAGLGPLQSMLGTGLKVAAGAAATAVGLLGAGLASSISDAADFQQGMADIQASMGASAEDTAKLKQLILDLGIDPKLKVSAQEAAAAIGQLGTAGVSIDDILKGTARSTVLLANATGADFADAASIASDVSKLWAIDAGNLEHAVDGITAATVASKFNINDYRLALAQAGGVASTVGVSFDDFNATIAAISPSFASGSDAGTSFKVFLQRLIPTSDKAEDSMRALGLIQLDVTKAAEGLSKMLGYKIKPTLEAVNQAALDYAYQTGQGAAGSAKLTKAANALLNQFRNNAFYDANGQMKDMSQVVGILNKAFSGLTEEQKNQQLSIIFGTDAMRAAAAMAKMTTGDFENLQTTMAKTDAAESAKTRMDTLKGSLEILSGTFDTLKLMVGDKFLPVLNDLVKRFNDFLGAQAPMIVEWAGQLATRLGDLVTNYLPIFVVKLGEWWQWAKQLAVTLLDVGNQVWNFITGVKAALQPVIDFVARFVGLKEILLGVAAAFGVSAVVSLASFVAALTPVLALLGAAITVVAALHGAWVNNFAGIRDIVGGVINYLYDRFHLLWDFIKLFGPGALQEIGNWVTGTQTQFTNLSRIWDQVRLTAQVLFNDLVSYVRNSLPGWLATLQSWGAAAWQWIVDMTPIALAKLGQWAQALWGWIQVNYPAWLSRLQSWGFALWQWIVDATPGALAKLGEWLTALTGWILARLPSWLAALGQWAIAMTQWIVNTIPAAINAFSTWLDSLLGWGNTTGRGQFGNMLVTFGNAMMEQVAPVMGKLALLLLEAFGKITVSMIAAALKLGVDLILSIAQGLLNWAGIDVNLQNLHNHLFGIIDNWKNTMLGAGAAIMDFFRNGLLSGQNNARNGLDVVMDFIQQGRDARLPPFQQSLYDAGANAVTKLGQGFSVTKDWTIGQFNQIMAEVQNRGVAFTAGDLAGRLLQAGADMVSKLGQGFAQGAPGLTAGINTAFGGVRDLFNYWHDNLSPHFLGSAQDLASKIGMGFSNINLGGAVNGAMTSLRDVYNKWRDDLANHFFGSMQNLGGRIIDGLTSGIVNGIGRVISAIQGVTDALPQWVKDKLGIHSPSTVFAGLGQNIMEGLVQGMQSMAGAPQAVLSDMTAGMVGGANAGNTVSNTSTTNNQWTVNLPTTGASAPDAVGSMFRQMTALYAQ